MTTPLEGVMLAGFGGPPDPKDAVEFVRGVVGNRPGAEARIREVAHHYEEVGGSPFNALTQQQADALQAVLRRRGIDVPVRCGFKHWKPYFADTLAGFAAEGRRNLLGIVMAPHPCWSADDKYREAAEESARQLSGDGTPPVRLQWTEPFGRNWGYVTAEAALVREAADRIRADGGEAAWRAARLVFTAHSVPINGCQPCQAGTRTCPYPTHYAHSARMVAEAAGKPDHRLAYQSRATMRIPWLEPDIVDVIKEEAAAGTRDIVAVPIGFLCDHVEVLFDLDIEAKQAAAAAGVRWHRVPTVQCRPPFIEALADAVEARVRLHASRAV